MSRKDISSIRNEEVNIVRKNVRVIDISIEEIRAKGGISHLGLDTDVEEELMKQLLKDGILSTH